MFLAQRLLGFRHRLALHTRSIGCNSTSPMEKDGMSATPALQSSALESVLYDLIPIADWLKLILELPAKGGIELLQWN